VADDRTRRKHGFPPLAELLERLTTLLQTLEEMVTETGLEQEKKEWQQPGWPANSSSDAAMLGSYADHCAGHWKTAPKSARS
jgi:hypothetical protein